MSHKVETLIASVSDYKDIFQTRAVNHPAKRAALIGFSLPQQDGIGIGMTEQIIHSIQMEQIEGGLSLFGRKIGIRVIGVGGDLDVGTVGSNQLIAFLSYILIGLLNE